MAITLYDGYTDELWKNGLTPNDKYNQRHLLALFAFLGIPDSYADFGCGTGAMVKTAQILGSHAYGVDQLVDDTYPSGFYHANLVDSFTLPNGPVDLLTCFEVAEHLHESAHHTFCDTLCDNLKSGGGKYLIFSAARPGQGGTGHVACRPAEYWHNEFLLRKVGYNDFLTMGIAHVFSRINTPLNYFWDNLMVFEK